MDAQQVAGKVTQLESRVAALEDEGKIVKGEVKQILTEIRSAILVRDNPFEAETPSSFNRAPSAPATTVVQLMAAPEPIALHELEPDPPTPILATAPEQPKRPQPIEPQADEPESKTMPLNEPIMLRPTAPAPIPEARPQPQWSLLTIAGLSAWAEDAMRRVGSLRLEILLDLCQAAGHLTPEARTALARVTEMDIAEPDGVPSSNETVVILRQLDALVNDDESFGTMRTQRM